MTRKETREEIILKVSTNHIQMIINQPRILVRKMVGKYSISLKVWVIMEMGSIRILLLEVEMAMVLLQLLEVLRMMRLSSLFFPH